MALNETVVVCAAAAEVDRVAVGMREAVASLFDSDDLAVVASARMALASAQRDAALMSRAAERACRWYSPK